MGERDELARVLCSQYDLLPAPAYSWRIVVLCLQLADAILASDWLRDTLAVERERCAAAVATMAREWRDENRAAVEDGDTSLAAEKLRAAAVEMNAFAKAVERGEHREIRNLEPET